MTEVAYIPLVTRDRGVAGFALIDAGSKDELERFSWFRNANYAVRWSSELPSYGLVSMHRHICGLEKYDARVVHHINGDSLDNRRANLEVCADESYHQRVCHGTRKKVAA